MKKLLIATNNQGKITEIERLFADLDMQIVTPKEIGLDPSFDPLESGTTFAQNAAIKAKAFAQKTKLTALADDSGLIVDALDGRPGVFSKRYGTTDEDRNNKLLAELQNVTDAKRTARFVSVVCVYDPGTQKMIQAEGTVEGKISLAAKGNQGFGYDPVFIPTEIAGEKTFAQLGVDEKNKISHRARALGQIRIQLQKQPR